MEVLDLGIQEALQEAPGLVDLVGLLETLLLPPLPGPVQGPLPGGLASLQGLLGQVAPPQGLRQPGLALLLGLP